MTSRSFKKITLFSLVFIFVISLVFVFVFSPKFNFNKTILSAQADGLVDPMTVAGMLNPGKTDEELRNEEAELVGGVFDAVLNPFGTLGNFLASEFGKNISYFLSLLAYYFMIGTAWAVTAAGYVMDYVLKFTITDAKAQMTSTGVINAWKTFRDLGNIVFLFILLYAAINIIISNAGVDSKRIISRVIIVAILVNFSFFLTGIVIDIANIVALQFYDAILSGTTNGRFGEIFLNIFQPGKFFAGASGTSLSPQSISSPDHAALSKQIGGDDIVNAVVFFTGGIINLIAAFAFIIVSGMLILRLIALIFIILLSPIAFIASILPQTQGLFKRWWKELLNQSMYAPIFFMFLWLSIIFLTNGDVVNDPIKAGVMGKDALSVVGTGLANSAITLMIGIGFLIGSILIGKKLSLMGADTATKMTGNLTAGLAGAVGRGTFGAGSRAIYQGKWGEKMRDAAAKGGKLGRFASLGLKVTGSAASGTYDARNTGAFKGVATATGINAGTGSNRSSLKNFDDSVKKKTEWATKVLGTKEKTEDDLRGTKKGEELLSRRDFNQSEIAAAKEKVRKIEEKIAKAKEKGKAKKQQKAEEKLVRENGNLSNLQKTEALIRNDVNHAKKSNAEIYGETVGRKLFTKDNYGNKGHLSRRIRGLNLGVNDAVASKLAKDIKDDRDDSKVLLKEIRKWKTEQANASKSASSTNTT